MLVLRIGRMSCTATRVALAVGTTGALLVAGLATAAPKDPAPPQPLTVAPPPAWVEAPRGDSWLAYSTFSWNGFSLEIKQPLDPPTLIVRRGQTLRFHLGFKPTSALPPFLDVGPATFQLTFSQTPSWRVPRKGKIAAYRGLRTLTLKAFQAPNSATYRALIRVVG